MAEQLTARIPIFSLDAGCTVVFEAINPTTGAAITGVVVTDVAIYAIHETLDGATVNLPASEILLPVAQGQDATG